MATFHGVQSPRLSRTGAGPDGLRGEAARQLQRLKQVVGGDRAQQVHVVVRTVEDLVQESRREWRGTGQRGAGQVLEVAVRELL